MGKSLKEEDGSFSRKEGDSIRSSIRGFNWWDRIVLSVRILKLKGRGWYGGVLSLEGY